MSQNPYIQFLHLDPNQQNYMELLNSFINRAPRANRSIDRQRTLLKLMYGPNLNQLVADENNNDEIQYIFGEAIRELEGYMASTTQNSLSPPPT